MDPILLLTLLLLSFSANPLARPLKHATRITVAGLVYCDTCSNNGFTSHSYFLPGVDVNIRCEFKAISPNKVTISANISTDEYGVYELEIPSVEGLDCVDAMSMEPACEASLLGSSSSSCNVPALKSTTHEISAKSGHDNLCVYSLNAMSYRPWEANATLCSTQDEKWGLAMAMAMAGSFGSSKLCLPYFPTYGLFWPPLPQFHLPYLCAPPPSLSAPSTPPAFSLTDPTTWTPYIPPYPPITPQNLKP